MRRYGLLGCLAAALFALTGCEGDGSMSGMAAESEVKSAPTGPPPGAGSGAVPPKDAAKKAGGARPPGPPR